jgi:hypothetical protein
LANPYIQTISVGAGLNHPGEAAVLLFVNAAQIPASLANELEGVATRIIAAGEPGPHGIIEEQTPARLAPAVSTPGVSALFQRRALRKRKRLMPIM